MKPSWRVLLLILSAGLILVAGACGGDEPDEPEDVVVATEEAAIPLDAPILTVIQTEVGFREREMDDLRDLAAGEEVTVVPGANIVIGDTGHGSLAWAGFLTNELLSATDQLVSLSQPAMRRAILDQAAGTARYVLEGEGEAAEVTVKAGWIDVVADQGRADFIVSYIPGAEPTAWLAVLEGSAAVTRGEDAVTVAAGQAAAFTSEGPLPQVMDVDAEAVGEWFSAVADGSATASIASVAFRCEILADEVELRDEPDEDADTVGDMLTVGDIVDVILRDEDGEWLRVSPVGADEEGWIAVSDLSCTGPVANVGLTAPGDDAEPTATSAPLPTRPVYPTFTPWPTFTLGPATPTATPTPGAAAEIEFRADDTEIDAGDCTRIHWNVKNIREVYFDGHGVTGQGSERVCPDKTKTYTLRVVKLNGEEESRSIEIKVTGAAQPSNTPVGAPTSTRVVYPTAVPTLVPTAVPTAVPTQPPTAVPTQPPTAVPTQPPTAVPTAVPTDVPTDPPTAAPTTTP